MTNFSFKVLGETDEVFVSFCEHERRAARMDGFNDILADAAIPRFVADEFGIERSKLDSFVRRRRHCRLKGCRTYKNTVRKRTPHRLRFRVDAMPHRAALHEDDRMMAILPSDRCGQSRDELCFRTPDDLFKAVRRQMVALIDDHMTIVSDAIVNDTLADQTLDDRNIYPARRLAASTTDASDLTVIDIQKRRQAFHPLIQQLSPMD